MITRQNYYSQIENIDFAKLDVSLQESKEFVDEITEQGKSWDLVYSDESIKEMVSLYFEALEQALSTKVKSETKKSTVKSNNKPKNLRIPKPKKKTSRQVAYEKANKVELISIELKMIRRFILMHDKLKSQNQIKLDYLLMLYKKQS